VGAEEESPVALGGLVTKLAMNHATALNEVTREVIAGRPRVTFVASAFVPLPGNTGGVLQEDKAALYRRCALAIAPTLAGMLTRAPDRVRHPIDDDARSHAVRHIASQRGIENPRLTAVLAAARDALHARSADLFFVDNDTVYLLDATLISVTQSPRENALSSEVLEHPAGIVIPDLAADPRYRDRPQVAGPPHLRLYAGYPVESPDGQRVAVLAVVDTRVREFSPTELSLLRQFALKAGSLLFEGYSA